MFCIFTNLNQTLLFNRMFVYFCKFKQMLLFKGIVHPKMKILSLMTEFSFLGELSLKIFVQFFFPIYKKYDIS